MIKGYYGYYDNATIFYNDAADNFPFNYMFSLNILIWSFNSDYYYASNNFNVSSGTFLTVFLYMNANASDILLTIGYIDSLNIFSFYFSLTLILVVVYLTLFLITDLTVLTGLVSVTIDAILVSQSSLSPTSV